MKSANGDPAQTARAARLRYVTDQEPGIRRVRRGRGFTYVDRSGKPVRSARVLARIRSLAIPPAWTDVWICASPHGHLQAAGRDARGRKQYRYHPRWTEVRDATKYARMVEFGAALPRIRRRVAADLRRKGLSRRKVLAGIVRLLDLTLIRVGNDEYARDNRSYGLTTLRDGHVEIEGPRIRFAFRGKGGKRRQVDLEDPMLARLVRRCRDIPGQELFQYLDQDGKRQDVRSQDVNEYIREIGGDDCSAKDFRTWAATVLAAIALCRRDPPRSESEAKREVAAAVKEVATRLGNTPAICRRCYIHPEVITAYEEGTLIERLDGASNGRHPRRGLSADERRLLALLRSRA